MPLNKCNGYNLTSTSESYHDLRHLADDKTVLENPHKGWYYHLVDNSLKSPLYRENLEPKRFETPCMNHMYLRFDWGDVEPEGEGLTDWSEIDRLMDSWNKFGYRFTLRICTYEPVRVNPYATPKWVFDAGAGYTEIKSDNTVGYEPDYGDPIYLKKLDGFLKRCADKFDNDPRIEYVDVGTLGTWGEGHTYMGSGKLFSADTVMEHIKLHIKNFKNKLIVLNDDYIEIASRTSPEAGSRVYDYAISKGLGLRDDSICVDGYVKLFGYDTLRRPPIYAEFAKNAPVDIEFEHLKGSTPEHWRDGLTVIEALRKAHATYAGFHGYEDKWREMAGYLNDYLANRLGYWFFIDGIDIGFPTSGAVEIAKISISNRGYSKCYKQYDLKLRARDGSGRVYALNAKYPDSTRWERDCVSTETLRLDFHDVPKGEYTLDVGLFFGDVPIKLGIKEDLKTSDGYYGVLGFTVGEF